MIIWGRPLDITLNQVLDDLREEARKKRGLDFFKIRQNSGENLFVTCINYDAHGGPERTPSCSIHKESGMLHCFGCGYSDSLPGLVYKVLGLRNRIAGYRWLLRKYAPPIRGARPEIKFDHGSRVPQRFYLDDSCLDLYNYDHPYMYKRGLTPQVVDLFELGYDKHTDSITIPMRDVNDKLLFIKKRPIKRSKFHKYHIDEGVEKRDLVYGLNIIKQNIERVKMIYLCEGEFDVMSCYVAKKYGAGIQGDVLQQGQVRNLIRVAKGIPICLLFDNDNAGRKCREKAIPMLLPHFPLYVPNYPPGVKDPNDLLRKGLLENLPIEPLHI